MAASSDFVWSDTFLLGYQPMDETHREFVDLVGAIQSAPDEELDALLKAFIKHAEVHFEQERQWMAETNFPAMDCHIDEHNAVMKSLREVDALVRDDKPRIVRSLTAELVRWFPGHADYLDSALAQWMVKKRHGGVPVVLKRNLARPEG